MTTDEELRKKALANLEAKAGFLRSLGGFAITSVILVVIWAVSGAGYFWPGWAIGGMVIGLAFMAWHIYGPDGQPSDAKVQAEMDRLRGN